MICTCTVEAHWPATLLARPAGERYGGPYLLAGGPA